MANCRGHLRAYSGAPILAGAMLLLSGAADVRSGRHLLLPVPAGDRRARRRTRCRAAACFRRTRLTPPRSAATLHWKRAEPGEGWPGTEPGFRTEKGRAPCS